ncbi:hypothetical protein K2173_007882 [Erythroxylum novogranatense]|uniref:Phosphoglycerate mutase-like protein 1 n=1 Tax=Erythroxylum novogranatense TaxID=1862640 RepID=A0AAV8T8D3_9ROSI|nr:hypothetical protein K2173_007882 [Erythroxylum novogranatense]
MSTFTTFAACPALISEPRHNNFTQHQQKHKQWFLHCPAMPLNRTPTPTPNPSPSILCLSSLYEMNTTVGQSLLPLDRTKTLHLVRHAQGIHNVYGEKDSKAYFSEEYFDAHLTPLGWQQVENLRKDVQGCGLHKRIELVITSPLLRTMQTAVGVFGGEDLKDGIEAPPLMLANVGKSQHPAISSLNCPPIMAVELCRESLNSYPCDRRRSISEYQQMFPAIDFSVIESNADILWKADDREKHELVAARGLKFLNWLWTRKEKEIAVVSHATFLKCMLSNFGKYCHPSLKGELNRIFANCELRSLVLVDRW